MNYLEQQFKAFSKDWILGPYMLLCLYHTGYLKKRNLFGLEYLRDDFVKLVVLLVCYTVLPYNSLEHNFGFL